MDLLLGIDVGTTTVKAGLFAPDKPCLASAREEYLLDTPAPGWAQFDPRVYWREVVQTVRRVVQQSGCDPRDIRALAVSSQGETAITLDRAGNPLYPAIVWFDNRADRQAAELAGTFSSQVYDFTGVPELVSNWTACKLLWLRQNEKAVFEQAWKFMLVQDYIIYRLTGRVVTDGSISCTTAYYDIRRHVWWPDMLDAIGVRLDQLPEIVAPGASVGGLSAQAAEELGLSPATRVVAGGMDQATGAVGSGNIAPGTVSESTGAALAIQATVADPGIDPGKAIAVYCHSVAGAYLLVPVCPTAGMALKWLRDTFFQPEIQQADAAGVAAYDMMTVGADAIHPGADGLVMLPHLMGALSPAANPSARGAFCGFTLSHQRPHFVRALLEGVAFMLCQNLDALRQVGVPIHELRLTGGGARSRLWNQIKADVCRLPAVTLENDDTALLGDAIVAGAACGVFESVADGSKRMVAVKERLVPGPRADEYRELYRRYCDLDNSLAAYFRRNYRGQLV